MGCFMAEQKQGNDLVEFDIEVARVSVGFATIRVKAASLEDARAKALEEAGNHLFSEKTSEYNLV